MILYHATPVSKVRRILRTGLKPSRWGFVYLARTPKTALEQGLDALFERGGVPEELAVLSVSVDPKDLTSDKLAFEMDEDIAVSRPVQASSILGVVKV